MELWGIALTGALTLCALVSALRLLSLRRALREIAEELDEKLRTDTNTLISLSTGDRAARALAGAINEQLQALRSERLRLRNGDAALKASVTNVSHDLRTPLTAICGYLDLLEQQPLPERASRYLAVVRERTDAMRALTEELFRYSLFTSADDAANVGPVRLNDILEQSLAGAYHALATRGITPEIRLPETAVVRTLDSAALRRIYDNILSNAVKYSDGDLSVALLPDGTADFTNRTRGLGRVQAARLFDRYFTVETARGSTGLGLSIARQLTERMGGHIMAGYDDGTLQIRVRFPE